MKKITVFFSLFLIVIICTLCLYAEFSFRDISAGVVRLHVLANSNTEEDQKLKLKVRDCILEQARTLLANVGNKGDSMAILEAVNLKESKVVDVYLPEAWDYLPNGEYGIIAVVGINKQEVVCRRGKSRLDRRPHHGQLLVARGVGRKYRQFYIIHTAKITKGSPNGNPFCRKNEIPPFFSIPRGAKRPSPPFLKGRV